MSKRRILFCDNNYASALLDPFSKAGGATRQVIAWVEGLRKVGMDVKVLAAHKEPSRFESREEVVISYNRSSGIPKLRYLYIRIPAILKGIVRTDPEFIYYGIPSPFAGLLAVVSRVLRRKFVLRISNDCFVDDRSYKLFDPIRYRIFIWGFKLAAFIICQNEYQVRCLRPKYPGKVFKVLNPYSGSVTDRASRFEERSYVAWVGIFQYQKNLPLLYEIARGLPEVPFRVAGGCDGSLEISDQLALEQLGKLPNVTLVGFLDREEVLKLLGEAVLLLNSSHYEGFSNTFLEAFSRGTPVVTKPQNDPDNIIQEWDLGAVFEDAESACAVVRTLLAGPQQFMEKSLNCRTYMKQKHDLVTQSRELAKILGLEGGATGATVPGEGGEGRLAGTNV